MTSPRFDELAGDRAGRGIVWFLPLAGHAALVEPMQRRAFVRVGFGATAAAVQTLERALKVDLASALGVTSKFESMDGD